VSELERLLAALESMRQNVRFMRDLPGSEAVRVPPEVLRLMENTAEKMAKFSETVRAMAARIAANAPGSQKRFERQN
jgi:hypothetical protein